jgi:hypothetical protein
MSSKNKIEDYASTRASYKILSSLKGDFTVEFIRIGDLDALLTIKSTDDKKHQTLCLCYRTGVTYTNKTVK